MTLTRQAEGAPWRMEFTAMASPCEVLLDMGERPRAESLGALARDEARRIEQKFSRYAEGNILHQINSSAGRPLTVDAETAGLLDFADRLHGLSGGRFDITSGILRRVWIFDGSDRVPSRGQAKALLPRVGWEKAHWNNPVLELPEGMEIDLGGIGKEYAVDRVAAMLAEQTPAAFLVNFGGDLRAVGTRSGGRPWEVGVERPGFENQAHLQLNLEQGALATSGDANRFLLRNGVRYPHILNPRTGWPVLKAPRSVTVLADTCTEAGCLATLAMLEGAGAENFLREQDARHWIIR
jgi:thiamine biosynthesis lipoprotein